MKTTVPLISVIIPVYNAEKYLRECLDGITGQTLKNIEIICVNDGSTDGGMDVLRAYEKRDKRIKVINKKNEGANYARRDGYEVARGEWVAFIDADDLIAKDYLENLAEFITADTDVVMGETRVVTTRMFPETKADNKHSFIKDGQEIYKLFISQWVVQPDGAHIVPISPWAKIIRRSVLENSDWYQSNYGSGNDSLMMRQVFQNMKGGLSVVYKPIYHYFFSRGLGFKKQFKTNTGKVISRLEYEIQRYYTDLEHANKKGYALNDIAVLTMLNITHEYLISYSSSDMLTRDDVNVVDKWIGTISINFGDKKTKDIIKRDHFNHHTLESFYEIAVDKGVEAYIAHYYNRLIAKAEHQNAELQHENTELQTRNIELQQHIDELQQSLSWKITSPLRQLNYAVHQSKKAKK